MKKLYEYLIGGKKLGQNNSVKIPIKELSVGDWFWYIHESGYLAYLYHCQITQIVKNHDIINLHFHNSKANLDVHFELSTKLLIDDYTYLDKHSNECTFITTDEWEFTKRAKKFSKNVEEHPKK